MIRIYIYSKSLFRKRRARPLAVLEISAGIYLILNSHITSVICYVHQLAGLNSVKILEGRM